MSDKVGLLLEVEQLRRERDEALQRERRKERVAVELAELLQFAALPPVGVRILKGILATNHWLRDELERRQAAGREKPDDH